MKEKFNDCLFIVKEFMVKLAIKVIIPLVATMTILGAGFVAFYCSL